MTKKDLMEYIEELDDDCEIFVNATFTNADDKQVAVKQMVVSSIELPCPRDEAGLITLNAITKQKIPS
jgi:hypothetical protein